VIILDKTYHNRKEHRLCVWCAKPLQDDEKTRCKECAAIHNEKTKKDRDLYRKIGICIACGCEEAEPGKSFCIECAEKNRLRCRNKHINKEKKRDYEKKLYADRKANGICVRCGKRKSYKGTMCGICAEKHRDYKRIRYGQKNNMSDM
jgi:hypothetical protein